MLKLMDYLSITFSIVVQVDGVFVGVKVDGSFVGADFIGAEADGLLVHGLKMVDYL